jgi:hypothetical protein
MQHLKLFEDFSGGDDFTGITLQDVQGISPGELGYMVWGYTAKQPRAWGQWMENQSPDFISIYNDMVKADMDHGLADGDADAMGKYLLNPKNLGVLNDIVSLFNHTYPGVDYK